MEIPDSIDTGERPLSHMPVDAAGDAANTNPSERPVRCLLLCDFNPDTFAAYLENDDEDPDVQALTAPYGQVVPIMRNGPDEYCDGSPRCAVIWTQPERIIPSFGAMLQNGHVDTESILEEVDGFARHVIGFRGSVPNLFLPTWAPAPHMPASGMLSMQNELGVTNLLMRMNLRLADRFESTPGIHLLDSQRWISQAGQGAFNPKLWYMCKIPFGNEVFRVAAMEIKAALRGIEGLARKFVIVDLDNTLWGGIVGECGWQGLNLGGHHALGEGYADFQRALKALTRRGIILGICSKNTESVALEAISSHPEMVLKTDDFAGWRINWNDKAQNIAELTAELGLGLQSTVFIDDNPAERARVREALPEVAVPEWPKSPVFYRTALMELPYFDSPALSDEDLARTRLYTAERKRKALRADVESAEDWLGTLNTTVRVEPLNQGNLRRVVQLLNKTNQLNLSTRRLSESELLTWLRGGERKLWAFRVSDRFGDQGLCGIASLEANDGIGRIVDFVLSCRVIGRKVEETMLYTVISHARAAGLRKVSAEYLASPRNEPCRLFFEASGLGRDGDKNRFAWRTDVLYPKPDSVRIEVP